MKNAKWPIIIAVTLVVGILIGNFYAIFALRQTKGNAFQGGQGNTISEVVSIIDQLYVDSVSADSLSAEVIPMILAQLDPHSAYIPAEDLKATNEELNGSFSGIGVQFNIQNDTVYVVDVINGGPSQAAGILAGDRIVTVDDSVFVGKRITNERVMKTLRGEKGTVVKLGIERRSSPKVLPFSVTRGDIPVKSVDVAYMITPDIGFINVNKFASTTYREFLDGLAKLRHLGAKKLIVDLRGNSGGFMDAAINMLNEFLKKGDLLVYVEGSHYKRNDSFANGTGTFQSMPLVVLTDEFSGSASEIFAGAIQDNDRGTIIGRRTFGKGLVQQQIDLSDGSAVRITVARYYTPSGRSIQKPYKRGHLDDYDSDLWERYVHGEFYSQDSIHQTDTTAFKTVGGRTVYGGGGIMPDIFVPRDSAGITRYYNDLSNSGVIYRVALDYTDRNREKLKTYSDWKSLAAYLDSQPLFETIAAAGRAKDIEGTAAQKSKSERLIKRQVNAYIIRNILGDDGIFPYVNADDNTVKRAIKELGR